MISLGAILRGLKTLLGIAETARDIVDVGKDLADTRPSRQLSPADVRHQQEQIARATSFKVPPKVPPKPPPVKR